jgi:cbb3-type cytochrome oxidase subunit 3
MKTKHTTLRFIWSIFFTIVLIAIFIFVLRVIKNKNHYTSAATIVLEEGIRKKENALVFFERINEVKIIEDLIDSHFVEEGQVDIFVDYLEKLGTATGSEVVVRGIDIPEKQDNVIIFKLSISGDFDQVIKTVSLLENIPYQINITQFNLNKDITISSSEGGGEQEIIGWQSDVTFNIVSSN